MTAFWLRAIVVGVALMLMAEETLGCSCPMSGPPCQAASTADSVFVGTVRGIESIDRDPSSGFDRLVLVRMDVERWFVNAVPRQVEIVTGPGGGDCGYRFANGGRYLVYAWKTETSRYRTSICSRTRPLDEAREDLRYLTAMPPPGRQPACTAGSASGGAIRPRSDRSTMGRLRASQ